MRLGLGLDIVVRRLRSSGGGAGKALSRTAEGLLHRNVQDFVSSEWSNPTNLTRSVSGGGDLILNLDASGTAITILNTVPSRSKVWVHTRQYQNISTRTGVALHINDDTAGSLDDVDLTAPFGFSSSANLAERLNGSSTIIDSLASQNYSGVVAFSLFADGSSLLGWDSFSGRSWSGTSPTYVSGQVGLMINGNNGQEAGCTQISVALDHVITVTGLSPGDSVEVRRADDTVTAAANESGGSASIDLIEVTSDASVAKLVVVRDAMDLDTFEPSGGETPIWGGDVFEMVA